MFSRLQTSESGTSQGNALNLPGSTTCRLTVANYRTAIRYALWCSNEHHAGCSTWRHAMSDLSMSHVYILTDVRLGIRVKPNPKPLWQPGIDALS